MMSALECFEKAAHCEAMAGDCIDRDSRHVLRDTARLWRRLGEASQAREQPGASRAERTVP